MTTNDLITTHDALDALYNKPKGASLDKEAAHLTPAYRKWVEAAPFVAITSSGEGRLDCSPRGDAAGQLLKVRDEKTILIPDRAGNNRLDTLRNLIDDPRIALLFLIPGISECLRVRGTAEISAAPELLDMFVKDGKKPITVLVITVERVYFQCGRALLRSQMWNPDTQLDNSVVPTAGQMIKSAAPDFDAKAYDTALPARQKATL